MSQLARTHHAITFATKQVPWLGQMHENVVLGSGSYFLSVERLVNHFGRVHAGHGSGLSSIASPSFHCDLAV